MSQGVVLCLALALTAGFAPRAALAGYDAFRPTPSLVADTAPMTTDTSPPDLHAYRLNGAAVKVDGKLDEPCWQDAPSAQHFTVNEPDRGKQPTEQTVFKVAYDEDALYFAVACWERDPRNVTSHLSRRDRFSDSDLVSVYLDPYDDKTTGYNFRVNPLGVQADAYIYNDGDRDDDWDAVWQAEVTRDKDGWYAELKIPFSSIRYRAASEMTWGMQLYRYMHGRGEDTAWVTWDREQKGFVSRFGSLKGIENIPAPRQLEIVPYVVASATDPAAYGHEDRDSFGNMGADLKYGVSSDLTLNATVQPDFGQVEADPANLNLSPFETFYSEKRPFFIEGNRFFDMNGFDLFYSRRIGTGDEQSRIRFAGKLTGKAQGNITIAALAAMTDVTDTGQAHNLFKNGDQLNRYLITRLGREWNQGRFRINLMQTVAQKTAEREAVGSFRSREAYTTGLDWNWDFRDRAYNFSGYSVGSIIAPEKLAGDPGASDKRYGTGGGFDLAKNGGNTHFGTWGRWETDRLDLNDVGFLSAPDEIGTGAWASMRYSPDGKSAKLNRANLNFNFNRSWLYADRAGQDVVTGARAWSYGAGHPQDLGGNINGSLQFRGYQEAWGGVGVNAYGSRRWETRGGPIIGEPETYGFWVGGQTDSRKELILSTELNDWWDVAENRSIDLTGDVAWNQSSAVNHRLSLAYSHRIDDTQYLDQIELVRDEESGHTPPGVGIGHVSYLFGDITQQTLSVTLRTNLLFDRNKSLELYLAPYQTTGKYSRVRELARADSYKLIDYQADPASYDFNYAALDLNMVYRWEYRPGSTFFLVWTQSRGRSFGGDQLDGPGQHRNELDAAQPFRSEPENKILAKVTYWLPL